MSTNRDRPGRGPRGVAASMGLVACAAVGLFALRMSSRLVDGMVTMLTLGLLGVAVLGVLFDRGASRAGWAGVLVFGGGYLAFVSLPWTGDAADRLPTTFLILYVFAEVEGFPAEPPPRERASEVPVGSFNSSVPPRYRLVPLTFAQRWTRTGEQDPFEHVGHCLGTLGCALIGATTARWFDHRRRVASRRA